MGYEYINFDLTTASDRWARRRFWRGWRSILAEDPRWAPPMSHWLRQTLATSPHPHLARMDPALFQLEAVRRRVTNRDEGGVSLGIGFSSSVFEETVGAAVLLTDPRAQNRTAYLALPHVVNDEECMDRLIASVMEQMWERGYQRLVGPVGLSPRLGVGALVNHFNVTPPLHTPYNPPYVPDLLAQSLEAIHEQELYHVATQPAPAAPQGPAIVMPAPLHALRADLLPLFQSICAPSPFPAPDDMEIGFLADAIGQWPSTLWVAHVDGSPVGFVWLQGDFAPRLRRAHGGQNPLWRLWIALQRQRPAATGRLILGGVAPAWRGKGIGRQLWQHACLAGHLSGWASLSIGPVDVDSPAAAFLARMGAEPRQRYVLYASDG